MKNMRLSNPFINFYNSAEQTIMPWCTIIVIIRSAEEN